MTDTRKPTTPQGAINRRKAIQTQRAKDFQKREKARELERFLQANFNQLVRYPVPGR